MFTLSTISWISPWLSNSEDFELCCIIASLYFSIQFFSKSKWKINQFSWKPMHSWKKNITVLFRKAVKNESNSKNDRLRKENDTHKLKMNRKSSKVWPQQKQLPWIYNSGLARALCTRFPSLLWAANPTSATRLRKQTGLKIPS